MQPLRSHHPHPHEPPGCIRDVHGVADFHRLHARRGVVAAHVAGAGERRTELLAETTTPASSELVALRQEAPENSELQTAAEYWKPFPMAKPKKATPKKPKVRNRYSIGEWYGVGLETLSSDVRFQRAQIEREKDEILDAPCPFQPEAKCNKKGGVCSLRQYQQVDGGPVSGAGPIITTCPQRFLEGNTIFQWVGETLLKTKEPVVLSEIGFLDRLRPEQPHDEDHDSRDFIGRIDNVLVHPTRKPMEWCALELQAVYFSGKSMANEFKMLSEKQTDYLPFPAKHRRPDWRSSGPKRLLPQLQTKVPTIRTWGKKLAVVIDEAFFQSLVGLDRERHLSNAEIVWFVVGYDPAPSGWTLVRREVVFTKLDASVKSLTGGTPLSRERFEHQLQQKLKTLAPSHPLVATSKK